MAKKAKRNPQDSTLRNNNARKRDIKNLEVALAKQALAIDSLSDRVLALEQRDDAGSTKTSMETSARFAGKPRELQGE